MIPQPHRRVGIKAGHDSLGGHPTDGDSAESVDADPPARSQGYDSLTVDCDRCSVRGTGCADCVVTFLLGGPPFGVELDATERQALDVLAAAGLVPPLRMVEVHDERRIEPA